VDLAPGDERPDDCREASSVVRLLTTTRADDCQKILSALFVVTLFPPTIDPHIAMKP